MTNFDFDDKEFIKQIGDKVTKIISQVRTGIMDAPKFKILYSQHLLKLWEKIVNRKHLFYICISEDDIENIDFTKIQINIETIIINSLKLNNEIFVDAEFNILQEKSLKFNDTNEAYKHYKELSSHGYCVFYFGPMGVEPFVKGVSEDINIFYCEEDLERYFEKKDISQIKEVFEIYKSRWLSNQCEYSLFFENIHSIKQVDPSCNSKNILRNKPEKLMRDHLRKFLNEYMQHTFLIETELAASKKKLDIYTEVDGKFYFFEIKWLGKSISDDGSKFSTEYTDFRARDGVKQTLDYIKELIEVMNVNVNCGFLVIYDARDEKNLIDYQSFEFLGDEHKKYIGYFDKVDNLHIDNKHPA